MLPIELRVWWTVTVRSGWHDRPARRITELLPRVWHQPQPPSALDASGGLGHTGQLDPRRADPSPGRDLQRSVQRRGMHSATWNGPKIGFAWRPLDVSSRLPALLGWARSIGD